MHPRSCYCVLVNDRWIMNVITDPDTRTLYLRAVKRTHIAYTVDMKYVDLRTDISCMVCPLADILIDGTLAPKALRVVLRQSGLTINSSPHIANHYMFVFNFITLLLLRYCCHIHCKKRVFRNTTSCCNTAATDLGVCKHNFVAF